jgi:hypothetical protein
MKRNAASSGSYAVSSRFMTAESLHGVSGGMWPWSKSSSSSSKPQTFHRYKELPGETRNNIAGHVADNARAQVANREKGLYDHDMQNAMHATRGTPYYSEFYGAYQNMYKRP